MPREAQAGCQGKGIKNAHIKVERMVAKILNRIFSY